MSIYSNSDVTVMAQVGSPFGINGLNKLHVFTEEVDSLIDYNNFLIRKDSCSEWNKVSLSSMKVQGKGLLVKINNSSTPEEAGSFACYEIGVLKSDLCDLEEGCFYYHQIEGLLVIDQNNNNIGRVKKMWSNGGHDVFEVLGPKNQILPFIDSVIVAVDLAKKTLKVNWDSE